MAARTLPDLETAIGQADEVARAAAERLATARDTVLRDRLEQAEPVVRQARISLWKGLRALLVVLTTLPRVLVAAVSALSSAVENAGERGADLNERFREAAEVVPRSRRERRRSRLGTAAWAAGGFAVGLAVGWVLAQRAASSDADDDFDADDASDPNELDVSANGPAGSTGARSPGAERTP